VQLKQRKSETDRVPFGDGTISQSQLLSTYSPSFTLAETPTVLRASAHITSLTDFHDLRAVSRLFSFDGLVLAEGDPAHFRTAADQASSWLNAAHGTHRGVLPRRIDVAPVGLVQFEEQPLRGALSAQYRYRRHRAISDATSARSENRWPNQNGAGAVTAPIAGSFLVPTDLASID
jgi:hypothetical protein